MDCEIGQRLLIYRPHTGGQFSCKVIKIIDFRGDGFKTPALVVELEDGTIETLTYLLKGLSWEIDK